MWKCDLHITLYEAVVMYRQFQKYPCYFLSLKSLWDLHRVAAEGMAWGMCGMQKSKRSACSWPPANGLLFPEKRWIRDKNPPWGSKTEYNCIFRKPSDVCHLKAGDSHEQDTSWHSSRTLYKSYHNDLYRDVYVLVAPELCGKGRQCNHIQMGAEKSI